MNSNDQFISHQFCLPQRIGMAIMDQIKTRKVTKLISVIKSQHKNQLTTRRTKLSLFVSPHFDNFHFHDSHFDDDHFENRSFPFSSPFFRRTSKMYPPSRLPKKDHEKVATSTQCRVYVPTCYAIPHLRAGISSQILTNNQPAHTGIRPVLCSESE